MYAMQYEITLPADYDMQIIRSRVAIGGAALDHLPGLGLKAYAIRERGVSGSQVNQYAPLYLWNDTDAMARFLVGGGFQNIIRDFGRPQVSHWTGVFCAQGGSRTALPLWVTRRLTQFPIDPDFDATGLALTALIEEAADEARLLAARVGVHTVALAIDPSSWRLARIVLWNGEAMPNGAEGDLYQVLHISAPGLAELPSGKIY